MLALILASALNCQDDSGHHRGGRKEPCPIIRAPDQADERLWTIAGPARVSNTRSVWNNTYPAEPKNTTIERVRASCEETCVRIGRASTRTIVRDAEFTRPSMAAAGKIDAGIRVGGAKGGVPTAGVLIERVWSHGWRQVAPAEHKKYLNGDGIVVNRDVVDVTIRYSRFDDNADGGVDTKADKTVLDHVSAANNGHYGFRFWGPVTATTLTSTNNAWGAIEAEADARVTIDKLIMVGDQELVTTKPGAEVTIKSCDLSKWTGTALTKGPGKVTLGAGCQAEGVRSPAM